MSAGRAIAAALVLAASVLFAIFANAASAGGPDARPEWSSGASLAHPVALPLRPGQELTVRGIVRSSFDGASFDAAEQGLYDFARGGLVLQRSDVADHASRYVVASGEAAGCVAAGLTTPCLLPRIDLLAHERLLSQAEFLSTLRGDVQLVASTPAAPPISPAVARVMAILTLACCAIALVATGIAMRSRRRRSPIGQVALAAAEARKATRGDPMLAPTAAQITELVRRARQFESARLACAAKLAAIDRHALAKKRSAWATSTAPEAIEALAWVSAEHAEATRLEADRDASLIGIERIASALRVITLRARSHRGIRVRAADPRVVDPVDTVATELALRDEAIAEAERLT